MRKRHKLLSEKCADFQIYIVKIQEKPHKCKECERSFPTPGDLRAHGYSHTGNWPFRCPVCNRGFCKLGVLHHHIKSHGKQMIMYLKKTPYCLLYICSTIFTDDRSYCNIYNEKVPINNLRIHEYLQNLYTSNNNAADYASIRSGTSRIEIIKFESLSNNYTPLNLPTMYPWHLWIPLKFKN